jgi:hypothetical protein
MSTDPVPDPSAPEAASRIGSILASAERQVTEILAEADRQAALVHEASARRLQAREHELEQIASALVAAAAVAQEQLDRLRALPPVELPDPGRGSSDGASAAPPPVDDAPAPDAVAADHDSSPAHAASADHVAPDGHASGATNGAGILHRPAEWIGVGEPAGRPEHEPAADHAPADHDAEDHAASGAAPDADGEPSDEDVAVPSADEAADATTDTDASADDLADMPIIAESDGAPYPEDPPEKIDSARLVALSMAANGRSRDEVEAHVRDELGIVDHAALIDYVFGISAPSSIVPSWPPRRRRRGA